MLIGYARVSTADQRLDMQVDALERAGCERIFSDYASGRRADRAGLEALRSHLRPGDTLVVWKLDRLGRTVRQLVEMVAELNCAGINFASVTDGIDTSTPSGRFFFHVMAALAEMERDLVRERTRAGLSAAKARGRVGGRKPKLTKQQLTHARRLLDDLTTTGAEVAETLGVSRSTLYRSLARTPGRRDAGSAGQRRRRGSVSLREAEGRSPVRTYPFSLRVRWPARILRHVEIWHRPATCTLRVSPSTQCLQLAEHMVVRAVPLPWYLLSQQSYEVVSG